MNTTLIKEYVENCKGIAWDNCHKIYVLMDDEQMSLMEGYKYDPLISSDELSTAQLMGKLLEWYMESCSLRFIQAVRTDKELNNGFTDLVSQFEGYVGRRKNEM
jgi:hypothetical protein